MSFSDYELLLFERQLQQYEIDAGFRVRLTSDFYSTYDYCGSHGELVESFFLDCEEAFQKLEACFTCFRKAKWRHRYFIERLRGD